jgi:hypothetical protein
MNHKPSRLAKEIRRDCAEKLRSIEINVVFLAILASLLEEDWTTPNIMELRFTPDRRLWVRRVVKVNFKGFRCAEADLIRNIHGVAAVAELDGDVVGYLLGQVAKLKEMNGQVSSPLMT